MSVIKCGLLIATVMALSIYFLSGLQVEVNDPGLEIKGDLLYLNTKPFTGVTIERYPEGRIYRQVSYVNGLKEGQSYDFGLDGQLRTRSNYHLNKKHGLQAGWFLEGPKRFIAHFNQGLLEGPQIEWHMNGTIFRQEYFVAGVERDKKILYRSGEVFTNYTVKNSRIYGIDGGPLCFEPKKEGAKSSNRL